jgi:PII-like signaling protein
VHGSSDALDRLIGSAIVDAECIKLTSYLGERQRANGMLVGDALIDLYSKQQVAAITVLRGIEGFGRKHHLRTDRSLSPSEDLPLTVIAVDIRPNIEAVLAQTLELNRSGLVTLQPAQLLWGEIDPVGIAENAEATRLTVFFGRHDTVYAVPAFEVMCELLHRRGIAGATVLSGVDGIAHGRRQRSQFFSRNADSPLMVIAVGSGDRIGQVLPELGGLLRRPLMTLEQVRICKRDGQLINRPETALGADESGFPLWQKLTVSTSEAARHDGQPIHRAIVRRLRSARISGVTTHRGIWGFHGDRPPHGNRFIQLVRHVPAVTTVIDSAERISAAFDVIDEITSERGLVTSETLPAIRATSKQDQRGKP